MLLPSDEDLDEMAIKLTGAPFAAQPTPNEKAKIMDLCLSAERNHIHSDLLDHVEALVKQGEEVKELISSIDENIDDIRNWFKHSKLWDGL